MRRRPAWWRTRAGATDYDDIVRMFYWLQPEVILGGGAANFLPKSDAARQAQGRRELHRQVRAGRLRVRRYGNGSSRPRPHKPETRKLLGLFNDKNIDGALDRKFLKKGTVGKFPDQPDLTDEMRAALQVLSRGDKGFLLMVEAGRIDKYSHSLDWERAVYDTIMFDNVVKLAKDFAAQARRYADHRRAGPCASRVDHRHLRRQQGRAAARSPADLLRCRISELSRAGRRRLPAARSTSRAASRWCSPPIPTTAIRASPTWRARTSRPCHPPRAGGEARRSPTRHIVKPGAARKIGNLPITARNGVHAADDVVLTAAGPGADVFRGRVDNTFVFRAMARALGLGG